MVHSCPPLSSGPARVSAQIIVMSEGVVAERGTHRELLERAGGEYRQLVEAQLQMDDAAQPAPAKDGRGGAGRGASLAQCARPK